MNSVIQTLLQHRTYREFDPAVRIPAEQVQCMLDAARQAPSWMNGQHYSIIRITDPELRQRIVAHQPNNPQIGTCAEYWIFVADARRAMLCSHAAGGTFAAVGTPDTLITLTTDAALAAQNAVVAAESLGYGTCFTGSIRLINPELVEWLGLPPHTYPLFGLCIGKPSVDMRLKPRLPQPAVVAENAYPTDGALAEELEVYEDTMTAFAESREKFPYREKFARYYSQEYAPRNIGLLHSQGLLTHPDGLNPQGSTEERDA
ncbi:MAG: nitroreductase family protein [Lautropia sp.]|nr:nitroreductase family protein [Lautropia sp.]